MAGPNPAHIYRQAGVYNVTLTVTKKDAANGIVVGNSSVQNNFVVVTDNNQPQEYVFSEKDNKKTYSIERNGTFDIYLEECGTCGYQWNLTASPGLRVLNEGLILPDANTDGGSGTHTWHFIADTVGQQSIQAIYKHPWEPPAEQDQTFRMTIIVR